MSVKEDDTPFLPSELDDSESAKVRDLSETASLKHFAGPMPQELRLGLAWQPDLDFLWALDVSYFSSRQGGDATPAVHAVVNAATGLEYVVLPRFALRCGLFSNFDASSQVTETSASAEKIDYAGLSLGGAYQMNDSSLSLMAMSQRGQGQARSVSANGAAPVRKETGTALALQAAISGAL